MAGRSVLIKEVSGGYIVESWFCTPHTEVCRTLSAALQCAARVLGEPDCCPVAEPCGETCREKIAQFFTDLMSK